MSLESASWVTELDTSNPTATDTRSQGDDHLRLIKTVLKASFPTASKAWYNPTSVSKNANYSVLAADMNKIVLVDTGGGSVTMTLPTLAVGDAGWECSFIKTTTDTNPFFIAPPSGTIQSGEYSGLAKTRRCIPGRRTRVIWTGSAWIAERVVNLPLGSVIDCPAASVPVGYEQATGQTLASSSTDYPDYHSQFSGALPDRRGLLAVGLDTPAVNRLTTSGCNIDGTTLGSNGGAETTTLARANLPNDTVTVNIAAGQGSHTHAPVNGTKWLTNGTGVGDFSLGAGSPFKGDSLTGTNTLPAMTGTFGLNGGVAQTPVNKVQPTIVSRMLVVVE